MNEDDKFLKRKPIDIMNVLCNLYKEDVPLSIYGAGARFISKILNVTPESVCIDFGGNQEDNVVIQRAKTIQVTAENAGAKIEFNLSDIQVIDYLNQPAFISTLPRALRFIQRREYFRISTPFQTNFQGRIQLNEMYILNLCNISLGGVGAFLEGELPDKLQEGLCLEHVELDLDKFGKFDVNMQLINITEHKIINRKNETVIMPRLGFRFLELPAQVERELQLVIFALERIAIEKSKRIR